MEPYHTEQILTAVIMIPGIMIGLFSIGIPLRSFYDDTKSPAVPRYSAETAATVIPYLLGGIIILIAISYVAIGLLEPRWSSSLITSLMIGAAIALLGHLLIFISTMTRK